MSPTDTPPAPPVESVWSRGARTVAQAMAETNLSRQELWELIKAGTVASFPHGGRGTRLIAWGDLVDYLEGLHREYLANQSSTKGFSHARPRPQVAGEDRDR